MPITTQQLAEKLNNCIEKEEISTELEQLAKENNLVVVFGYSDDNTEFRGAINDEVGSYGGTTIGIDKNGIYYNECEDDCPYYLENEENKKQIKAIFDEDDWNWSYQTDIPHETFHVLDEDGRHFCKGIVFSLDNLGQTKGVTQMDKTKRYILKDSNPERTSCSLYYLPELDKYSNQEPGWQFHLGFYPYSPDQRDINWDDLPEWMQTAFLNNSGLIVKDYKPGDDFEDEDKTTW